MLETKPFKVSKQTVMKAYKLVKANAGTSGIDQQTLDMFDKDLRGNLYKIWNRLSSGSYFPPAVKTVAIPKKQGGQRMLGIPTVADRIAQMVIKLMFEPSVEPHFLPDSYGYRPRKSAIDAIGVTRSRCWKYNYVLEFDIKGLFDNIDHELLMKAVNRHTDCRMIKLYIERWIKAPLQGLDGKLVERTKGTPQGGVISPLLSNLFMHYVFDVWMTRNHLDLPWCRYADDGLVHCVSEKQAEFILSKLKQRFMECGLEMHPEKTKIVYCKDSNRKEEYPNTSFDFLGYRFKRRKNTNGRGQLFMNFTPGVSDLALKEMRSSIRQSRVRNRVDLEIKEIAAKFNPILYGWIGYYGRYNKWSLEPLLRYFNRVLVVWARAKYKRFRSNKVKATKFIMSIYTRDPKLFAHWNIGMKCTFV